MDDKDKGKGDIMDKQMSKSGSRKTSIENINRLNDCTFNHPQVVNQPLTSDHIVIKDRIIG